MVSRIDNADGTPEEIFGPKKLGVLQVSKSVMDIVRNGLRDVTLEGGTAGEIFKGLSLAVAGKTGTAENATGRDHGWFVAYAPYDKPRIVVVALVEQGGFGAISAGSIVRPILEEYFHIPKQPIPPVTAKKEDGKDDNKDTSTSKTETKDNKD